MDYKIQKFTSAHHLTTLLFIIIDSLDGLLREIERADLGIQLGNDKKVGRMLFADDFVGVSGSKEGLYTEAY